MRYFRFALLTALLSSSAYAQRIKITKSGDGRASIDLSSLRAGAGQVEQNFLLTLKNDLNNTGYFSVVRGGLAEFRVTGMVGPSAVQVTGSDVGAGVARYSKNYPISAQDAATRAHQVADELLLALRGVKGYASARLALIGTGSGQKELYICGADGRGLTRLTSDKKISLSPSWGPNGDLYYTAYLKGYPDIYRINTRSFRRDTVCNFPGLNTDAAISPNGREMAMVLSKDGKPEVYVMPVGGKSPVRITNTRLAAKSSPAWSPDGSRIVYVSDQEGRPHLYVVSRRGGQPQRITSSGSENVSPDWGPSGIIYSTRVGGRYRIALSDPSGRSATRFISPDNADFESPSWAPDGRHVACTRTVSYRSSVYLLDSREPSQLRPLVQGNGDWYAPAFTP